MIVVVGNGVITLGANTVGGTSAIINGSIFVMLSLLDSLLLLLLLFVFIEFVDVSMRVGQSPEVESKS